MSEAASPLNANVPTVDFVNQFYAHYRGPVINELSSSPSISARWFADDRSVSTPDVPSLRVADLSAGARLPCRRLGRRLFWQSGLIGHCATTQAQVVVLTGDISFLSNWIAAAVLRMRRKRVLMWTHGWTRPDAPMTGVIKKSFYGLANGLLVYGARAKNLGRMMGYQKPIYVIGNSMGAPVGAFAHARPTKRDPVQRWCVVSRLIPERKLELVLKAMSNLASKGAHVSLTVVGDGVERKTLEAEAAKRELEVTFTGAEYDPDATAKVLANHDILISPGNVGLAAIHALSSGCPVATHGSMDRQMPEVEAVIDGSTGVFFREGDAQDLADQVWNFVATTDPIKIAESCEALVRASWSPEAHALRILAAIESEC